ncbi:ROK family protein [Methylobrevis albus]|uniref:ROK family protein n=1 Tax=Methylobrevis albus TaxID=2793297 RepID=A0A931HZ63_9HYPH|nr:ROK family protein [Methylobrevis albus]MBH0237150.1 ROK family protein [Methylobrevis albus]
MAAIRLGIDIGGTKIEALGLAPDGAVTERLRLSTPAGYDDLIAAVRDLVAKFEAAKGPVVSIGVGAPGSRSPRSGLWRNCNILSCNGRDLGGDLGAALGRAIRIENDANCFALSEAIGGAAAGKRIVYALTLGTGLGGGFVCDGVIHTGINGTAGEAGHVPMPRPTVEELGVGPCYCGRIACAEQFLSGTGFAADHARATGRDVPATEVAALAAAGDPDAVAAAGRLADRLARYGGLLATLIDPDVIVLGGGLARMPGLIEAASAAVAHHTFGDEAVAVFAASRFEGYGGARGAALLWPRAEAENPA